jgi:elongation factor Ts
MVKELRDKTGAGMMDCKAALTETGGDLEAAVDWLRTKGLAKAAKKAGRVAAEGLIAIAGGGGRAVMVEVNSETDFVARNPEFQSLVHGIAQTALGTDGTLAGVLDAHMPDTGVHVDHAIKAAIATIGENMTLRRVALVSVPHGVVGTYVHGAIVPGLGKIGVLVGLESIGDPGMLERLGRQVAMHVAADEPLAVRPEELDAALVQRERAIFTEQARESGKPEAVIAKIVEGRVRKFYEEKVLLSQRFIIDNEKTVEQAIMAAQGDGAPIKITQFVVFRLGEGVEKRETDFAAEVAAAAGLDRGKGDGKGAS